ncbi:hypothetical protein GSI_13134 [Ganoderma sinense ZZ0214-1]|uniref:Uncharacterized protein n=1 Tax=Ganoderma sinense ZZ0214-1 TaxID=1077348 RepID=A0A2G8RUQ3_9APHY|nr:hypothetical protein GSI_13134 [Ganoderma sinense ZZ0214-1]
MEGSLMDVSPTRLERLRRDLGEWARRSSAGTIRNALKREPFSPPGYFLSSAPAFSSSPMHNPRHCRIICTRTRTRVRSTAAVRADPNPVGNPSLTKPLQTYRVPNPPVDHPRHCQDVGILRGPPLGTQVLKCGGSQIIQGKTRTSRKSEKLPRTVGHGRPHLGPEH